MAFNILEVAKAKVKDFANRWKETQYNKVVDPFFNKVSNLPRMQIAERFIPQPKSKIGQFGVALGRGAVESVMNIPRNLVVGYGRLQKEQLDMIRQKRLPNLQNVATGAAPLVEAGLDLSTFGIGKSLVKTGAKEILKGGFKQAVKKGALQGAGYGGVGGLAYGVGNQYGKKFDVGEVALGTGAGVILGGVLGGGLAGLGTLRGLIKRSPDVEIQLRNKAGRWITGETPIKPDGMPKVQWEFQLDFNQKYQRNPYEPVMPSDLQAAIKYEAEIRAGATIRDINKPAIPGSITQPKGVGGVTVYRGGKLDVTKVGEQGISFSTDKTVAQSFPKVAFTEGVVKPIETFAISPKAKTLNFKDIPKRFKELNRDGTFSAKGGAELEFKGKE